MYIKFIEIVNKDGDKKYRYLTEFNLSDIYVIPVVGDTVWLETGLGPLRYKVVDREFDYYDKKVEIFVV